MHRKGGGRRKLVPFNMFVEIACDDLETFFISNEKIVVLKHISTDQINVLVYF